MGGGGVMDAAVGGVWVSSYWWWRCWWCWCCCRCCLLLLSVIRTLECQMSSARRATSNFTCQHSNESIVKCQVRKCQMLQRCKNNLTPVLITPVFFSQTIVYSTYNTRLFLTDYIYIYVDTLPATYFCRTTLRNATVVPYICYVSR